MAIDQFPLLKRLQVGSYDNSVILTFTADLYFYEQVVWPTLRSRGCTNNVVIMDARQYGSAVEATGTLLRKLGKAYSIWPVQATQAFHPKLILQTNEREARLIFGSGNLTVRGYSTNLELFSEIASTDGPDSLSKISAAWNLVLNTAKNAGKAVRRQLDQMRATSGDNLSHSSNYGWPRLIYVTPDDPSLIDQLKTLIGGASIRRLVIVSPFFDPNLQALRKLINVFGVNEVVAIVQAGSVSFPGAVAKSVDSLKVHEFLNPHNGRDGYLHAKAYVLQSRTEEYWIWGSANCSMAALAGQGNYEALLVAKGRIGEGIAALGLNDSLAKTQRIDPTGLRLTVEASPGPGKGLFLTDAAIERGEMRLQVVLNSRFQQSQGGTVKLWSQGVLIDQFAVTRVDDVTFTGNPSRRADSGTVICRLILTDKSGSLESSAVIVHFLEDLEQATPSRLRARMHRAIEAIHSGTFDWAKGLEDVCELVIKIGLHDSSERASVVNRKQNGGSHQPAGEVDGKKLGTYDDFVGELTPDQHATASTGMSNALEEIATTLRAQILRGVKNVNDEDANAESTDTWRYLEESDREAAETGASDAEGLPATGLDEESLQKEHGRVRRSYLRLMDGLNSRYAWLRNGRQAIGPDEFWRLDAVNLLVLDGCDRLLNRAPGLGPVLTAEDLTEKYLPAMAIFLGRICPITEPVNDAGPLIARHTTDSSDASPGKTLLTTCALLTGIVEHARRKGERTFDQESLEEWSHFVEITAARCLAAMYRVGRLPDATAFQEIIPHSTWLASLGCDILVSVFRELSRLARSILRCEIQFGGARRWRSPQNLVPGEWVCASDTGVTEVVRVTESKVEIAMIGQPETDEEWYKMVNIAELQRVNIPTKVTIKADNIAEELNHLLAYSDEDLEEWQEQILPLLKRGYLISWLEVRDHASSGKLRLEAKKLLERARNTTDG